MARKNQHTFAKRERERKKAEKAAEKRARRDAQKDDETLSDGEHDDPSLDADEQPGDQ